MAIIDASDPTEQGAPSSSAAARVAPKRKRDWKANKIFLDQLKFIGPGIVAAVAYCDPGNWATDLEAGSTFGYVHLFVILSASMMAIVLQILATRLGYVTGKDLAQHCRLRFYDRPAHTKVWRWCCLYPLYAVCEAGIIFTDLAELLGSAIALKMLIPRMPLWVGVLLTSTDVFIVLAFFNSYPEISNRNRRSMHIFEFSVAILVLIVLVSFIVLIVNVQPDWGDTFRGFLPSRAMIVNGGLYLAVSIVGATVMPHSIFLGSKVAISDRLKPSPIEDKETQLGRSPVPSASRDLSPIQTSSELPPIQIAHAAGLRLQQTSPVNDYVSSVEHCKAHVAHASFDIAISLFTLALPINAAILIVAAAAFYYTGSDGPSQVADLASAHQLLTSRVGVGSGYTFAIALLVAGQAASITVTLAGQIVSEGFIEWRTRPVVRRLVTRLIGIVPSAIVAASVGPQGVDDLLVGSQVALSMVLPFVVLPLIIFTSDPQTMTMPNYHALPSRSPIGSPTSTHPTKPPGENENEGTRALMPSNESTFENNLPTKIIVLLIFCICCVANVYAIVQLAQGRT
ncbi:hypothetical protein PTTG_06667 [Puccinia triticina 1-1 BBBD Race 1]|uniref:Uncharacterized protein n=2 Tax=Puccinia triticina TaxID=208348 RepID=A0A180H3U2_PUCT1|nr:uncharacterized protein PtA15_8A749 [Puccinia triticina]OAV99481.1 hypothetical protein PTTG_06667 [Puccinia triticina 1-1 BBBD Race 1]WAQ87842.1 hypothetical protein PtA15_8A749 [Puccinia triticina]WAR57720.1 hypothetical protein PtB15_8B773 [Puccinia triticina]